MQLAPDHRRRLGLRAVLSAFFVSVVVGACGGGDPERGTADASDAKPATTASQFVYAVNFDDSTVSAFKVDTDNGDFTAVPGSPFTAGVGSFQTVLSPSGKFLYVANNGTPPYAPADGSNVSGFAIDAATGALAPLPGSPFAAGSGVSTLAFTPSGAYLYAANAASNDVTAYAVDASSGALTGLPGSPFAVGQSPQSIAVDPSGTHLLVSNSDSADITVFAIDAGTGGLTPVAGSPFSTGDTSYTSRLAFGRGGKFVFHQALGVAGSTAGSLRTFTLDRTSGALVETQAPAAIDAKGYITANAAGSVLYIPIVGGLAAYAVEGSSSSFVESKPTGGGLVLPTAGGDLTELPGSPFVAGADPTFGAFSANGRMLFLSDCASNSLRVYGVAPATGALKPLAGGSMLPAGAQATTGACPFSLAAN